LVKSVEIPGEDIGCGWIAGNTGTVPDALVCSTTDPDAVALTVQAVERRISRFFTVLAQAFAP
jgi:hypothetical protein